MDEILVSVVCNTYNHEKYIRDALKGFVMQKTNFRFEVLIHDDASTDATPDIIREYEKKYPDIIKPLYEVENQYSKHDNSIRKIQYSRVKGKYIALCEGDDYWIDSNKLQIQVDYMNEHPECQLLCHNSIRLFCLTGEEKIENPFQKQGEVLAKDIIFHKPNCWPATATIMYRRRLEENRPEFFNGLPIGDYPLRVYALCFGEIHYIDKVMTVYRFMSDNSWSQRSSNSSGTEFAKKMIEFLQSYNDYTKGRFEEAIELAIGRYKYSIYVGNGNYKEICKLKYYKTLPLKKKIKVNLAKILPSLASRVFNEKNK